MMMKRRIKAKYKAKKKKKEEEEKISKTQKIYQTGLYLVKIQFLQILKPQPMPRHKMIFHIITVSKCVPNATTPNTRSGGFPKKGRTKHPTDLL